MQKHVEDNRTKTAETTVTGIVHHESLLPIYRVRTHPGKSWNLKKKFSSDTLLREMWETFI